MTFEKYLEEVHSYNYTGTDDNMVDAFDQWISCLDVNEIIIYADDWMNRYKSQIRMEIHELTK